MRLAEQIASWQEDAIAIQLPPGSALLGTVGGLPGPAFFPEGLGLTYSALENNLSPKIMAIGHNFGCEAYRESIHAAGREDDKATWRNLDHLLTKAGADPSQCFRTNWFIGLLPGEKQTGRFLRKRDQQYEQACSFLLLKQIRTIRPKTILFLGPQVAHYAYRLIPELLPWRDARKLIDFDRSAIGHSPRECSVPEAGVRANIALLLHPSFGAANQGRRMRDMPVAMTEVEIVRAALA